MIFAAYIDIASLRAGREARYRHRFDDGKRVLFHQHTVFERPGLRLVRVADDVVRAHGSLCDRVPLDAHREGSTAPSPKPRIFDLSDDAVGAKAHRPPERCVAAVLPILVQTRGVGDANAAENP